MKKALACGVSAVIATAMSFTGVFAALNQTTPTGSTVVNYNPSSKYTVTIPVDFSINTATATDVQVVASNILLDDDSTLIVKMSAENGVLKHGTSTVDYSYKLTTDLNYTAMTGLVSTPATILSAPAGTSSKTVTMSFLASSSSTPTYAGEHTDTLTFTASISES